jgi:carbamoyl-phosphate synthase large subunit
MAGTSLADQDFTREIIPQEFYVKEAVFPFNKFPKVDPILGPEMKSTGEVMGVGATFAEAFSKAALGAGDRLPRKGTAFISVREVDKKAAIDVARDLAKIGFNLVATKGTAAAIEAAGIAVTPVNKVLEGRPHIVDMIKNGEVDLIINTTEGKQAIRDSAAIRRSALQRKVYYTTTITAAQAVCQAVATGNDDIQVRRLQDLHANRA